MMNKIMITVELPRADAGSYLQLDHLMDAYGIYPAQGVGIYEYVGKTNIEKVILVAAELAKSIRFNAVVSAIAISP